MHKSPRTLGWQHPLRPPHCPRHSPSRDLFSSGGVKPPLGLQQTVNSRLRSVCSWVLFSSSRCWCDRWCGPRKLVPCGPLSLCLCCKVRSLHGPPRSSTRDLFKVSHAQPLSPRLSPQVNRQGIGTKSFVPPSLMINYSLGNLWDLFPPKILH